MNHKEYPEGLADANPRDIAEQAYDEMCTWTGPNHRDACVAQVLEPMCRVHIASAKALRVMSKLIDEHELAESIGRIEPDAFWIKHRENKAALDKWRKEDEY